MWSSGLTLDPSRLSRRAFLGGATGAVCASASLSSSASQGAPAAPQAPATCAILIVSFSGSSSISTGMLLATQEMTENTNKQVTLERY